MTDNDNHNEDEILFNDENKLEVNQDRTIAYAYTDNQFTSLSKILNKVDFERLVYVDELIPESEFFQWLRTVIFNIKNKMTTSIIGKQELKRILRKRIDKDELSENKINAIVDEVWEGDFRFTNNFNETATDAFEGFMLETKGEFLVKVKLFVFHKLPKRSHAFVGVTVSTDTVDTLFNDYLVDKHGSKNNPFKKDSDRAACIELYMTKKVLEKMADVKEKLKFNPKTAVEDRKHFDYFIKAFFGENVNQVVIWGWEQWFKNLKIKIQYGPNDSKHEVKNHVIPFVKSTQGAGKSYSFGKILAPLIDFTIMTPDPSDLFSEKYGKTFEQNYIHWVDETDRYNQADIGNVKSYSSAQYIAVRSYHTQNVASLPNRSCFLMLSNLDFLEVIKDATGIRRWLPCEINWESIMNPKTGVVIKQQRINRELFDKIDPVALLRGIDPDAPSVWNKYKEDAIITEMIDTFHEPYKTVNVIEDFYKNCMVYTDIKSESSTISTIHQAFLKYVETVGSKSNFQKKTFLTKLEEVIKKDKGLKIDFDQIKQRARQGTVYPFMLRSIHEVEDMKKQEYETEPDVVAPPYA